MYKDVGISVSLHPYVPAPPAATSWDSLTRVRHAAHLWRGVSIVDCQDLFFSWKGHRITLIGDLVKFHASGEGSRGHEILQCAAVPELMFDGVGVLRSSLPKELLEVVCGQPHLTLAITCGTVAHTTPKLLACLLLPLSSPAAVATYKTLLVPLPSTIGTLPSVLDGDIRQRFPAIASSWVKLGPLIVGSVLGGDAAQLLYGVPNGVGRCLKG
jgi:hypothetical protein